MKRLSGILFSVLLLLAQFAPTQAATACPKPMVNKCMACAAVCGRMDCCVARSSPDSKPAPTVPAQSTVQNQISLLASAVVIWTLPENEAESFCFASTSPLTAMSAPIYARNCTLLL